MYPISDTVTRPFATNSLSYSPAFTNLPKS